MVMADTRSSDSLSTTPAAFKSAHVCLIRNDLLSNAATFSPSALTG